MDFAQPRDLATATRLSPALAWRLNRLRCMGPVEVGHRLVKAAATRIERWGLIPLEVPVPDLRTRAMPWIFPQASIDVAAYRAEADRIALGRLDVFAMRDVELGMPPRWNRDPKTGIEAPLAFGKELDYRDPGIVGDIKYLWEPNRHLQLVTLAQAYALTGERRYALALRMQLESWFEQCPFRLGPNWSSSLEAGLRLINWALAWQLLGGVDADIFSGTDGRAFRAQWLDSVYRHAEFISGHLSLHSSANNHLVGELAGVLTAGLAWPHWPRARRWVALGKRALEREALLQNGPDGVNREQAVSYQQFGLDLLLVPMLAGRANGMELHARVRNRIEAMLEYLASIMDARGNVPMLGDADDGYAVRLDPRPGFCRYRSLLATGALLFGRGDFKMKAGPLDDKTRWLMGPGADSAYAAIDSRRVRLPVRRAFPDGGVYVLGCNFETSREIRLVADAGPLGYREIAAHGHADALSFTLSLGGHEMLVDPGTYAYHTEGDWRAYFRGTAAHNTVRVDGQDQSQPGGNFMWLRKAQTECLAWSSDSRADLLEARHDGYQALADAVIHRRRIHLDKVARVIEIEDHLEMEGTHDVELFFHFHEDCALRALGDCVVAERGLQLVRLCWPIRSGSTVRVHEGSVAPACGWVSRRFDEKRPSPTLAWSARITGSAVLRTRIDC